MSSESFATSLGLVVGGSFAPVLPTSEAISVPPAFLNSLSSGPRRDGRPLMSTGATAAFAAAPTWAALTAGESVAEKVCTVAPCMREGKGGGGAAALGLALAQALGGGGYDDDRQTRCELLAVGIASRRQRAHDVSSRYTKTDPTNVPSSRASRRAARAALRLEWGIDSAAFQTDAELTFASSLAWIPSIAASETAGFVAPGAVTLTTGVDSKTSAPGEAARSGPRLSARHGWTLPWETRLVPT